MQNLLRPLLLLTLVLLAPAVPFLVLGNRLESVVVPWLEHESGWLAIASMVIGLLAVDILLPIPSSLICTVGGARLGWLGGTAAAWCGMTLGASLGFAIARRWGRSVALRLTGETDLEVMQVAVDRWGTLVLIAARALPVVAEATVLLFGLHRMSWRKFLAPVMLSNLGISLAYSAFGDWAKQHEWLPVALGISVAFPLLLAALIRRFVSHRVAPP